MKTRVCRKHKWHVASWTNGHIWFMCIKCDTRRDRAMTSREVKKYKAKWDREMERLEDLHSLWWKYDRLTRLSEQEDKKFGSKYIRKFLHTGSNYPLMKLSGRFVDRHPEAKIVQCDDNYFSTSNIVLIPHRAKSGKDRFMGVSMVCIPQMSDPPATMFLYPGHIVSLIKELKKFARMGGEWK